MNRPSALSRRGSKTIISSDQSQGVVPILATTGPLGLCWVGAPAFGIAHGPASPPGDANVYSSNHRFGPGSHVSERLVYPMVENKLVASASVPDQWEPQLLPQ